jgi:hypothetical protein
MNGECSVCGPSACPPPGPRERARRASLSPTSERWHGMAVSGARGTSPLAPMLSGAHISVTSSGTATVRSLPFGAPSGSPAEALVVSQARLNDRALLPPGSTHYNLTHKSAAPEGTAPRLIILCQGIQLWAAVRLRSRLLHRRSETGAVLGGRDVAQGCTRAHAQPARVSPKRSRRLLIASP